MNSYKQLISILKELFQLDQTDLDFGIYRILNAKSDEITSFLESKLKSEVWDVLRQSSWSDQTKLIQEISDIKTSLQNAWVDPETSPKYQELQTQLKAGESFDSLEQDVYSHLTNFFKRYYKDGDFISLRRYKADTYAIPYEWEEVKLYRANHDQYYIKSTENLKNYIFTIDTQKVVFRLVDASTEQNNNKAINNKERRFQLHEEHPYLMEDGTLIIQFSYELHEKKTKQDMLNKLAIETLQSSLPTDLHVTVFAWDPTEKNKKRTILEKHLTDFTAKHSFDYFIHKDLDRFLRREMDFYIKNEVLHIDDIASTTEDKILSQIGKIKAIKQVAGKLITFLWQLENFQKRLWEKKKFVTNTQYCITLNKIDEKFYPEILANQAQLDEWKEYYDVTIMSVEEMKAEPFLVLDTIYFSTKFKDQILATFDDIDEECDGLLINSENWQALSLLQERYKGQVKCTYIDPPYNTGSDFAYKDSFMHSSWLSMMLDRISNAKRLFDINSRFYCSIDDRENSALLELLKKELWSENYLNSITREKRTKSQNTKTSKYMLQSKIEYIHPFSFNWKRQEFNLEVIWNKEYPEIDEIGKYRYSPIEEMSSESIRWRDSMIYEIMWIAPRNWKQWQIGKTKVDELVSQWRVVIKNNKPYIIIRPEHEDKEKHKPFWSHFFDKEIYWTAEKWLDLLSKKLWFGKWFDTVKPIELITKLLFHSSAQDDLILDFFSWSGTTWHAVINLNRKDKSKWNRKYILIEMWSYFDMYTKPRIKKVIYSDNRKDGKPTDKDWISQMFKYNELESYEDTLNNLNLSKTDTQQSLLTANPDLHEEYVLKYMLDIESRGSLLSINDFRNPFDYQLAITKHNETKNTTIDLVETFNYLIWLKVHRQCRAEGMKIIEWSTIDDQNVLVIRRNLDEVSNEKLNDFYKARYIDPKDAEFATIYVNGDTMLENLRNEEDHWKVIMIEEVFLDKMFAGSDSFSL